MTEVTEKIRVATEADADNLANLITTFRDHLGQQLPCKSEILISLNKLLVEDSVEFLIAGMDSGIPVAYTQTHYYYSLWSTGFEAQIDDLFVLPTQRRCGFGLMLVQNVVERARERGCQLIVLNTNERNIEALKLYSNIGFTAERSRWHGGRQLWLEMPL